MASAPPRNKNPCTRCKARKTRCVDDAVTEPGGTRSCRRCRERVEFCSYAEGNNQQQGNPMHNNLRIIHYVPLAPAEEGQIRFVQREANGENRETMPQRPDETRDEIGALWEAMYSGWYTADTNLSLELLSMRF